MSCIAGNQSAYVQHPASRVCCVSGSVRCHFGLFSSIRNWQWTRFNFGYKNYNTVTLNEQTFVCQHFHLNWKKTLISRVLFVFTEIILTHWTLEAMNCTFLTVTRPGRAVILCKPQCFPKPNQAFLLFKMYGLFVVSYPNQEGIFPAEV